MDVTVRDTIGAQHVGAIVLIFRERYSTGTRTRFHMAMPRLFSPLPDSRDHSAPSPACSLVDI